MPIYEYVCRSCGEPVEKLQKLSEPPLTDCPACGEAQLKRKVSAAGFRLSGGGWYETDFKSDGRRNVSASDDKSETAAKSDKGDSKEAASSDGADKKQPAGDKKAPADAPKSSAGDKKDATPAKNKDSGAGSKKSSSAD